MAKPSRLASFALGGATFLLASYILHCGYGMGPWRCQKRCP